MLISVLNIKLTCEWHKAIKLNYKNTHTNVIVFLRVTKNFPCAVAARNALEPAVEKVGQCAALGITSREPGTVRGTARKPHFSRAFISVTFQLWTQVFWVISVYFNIRNTLPKSGTFLLGHPVYCWFYNHCSFSSMICIRCTWILYCPISCETDHEWRVGNNWEVTKVNYFCYYPAIYLDRWGTW